MPVLIDVLLALGLVVVVPLALRLEEGRAMQLLVAAVLAACSFFVSDGVVAAALTIPYVIVTIYLFGDEVLRKGWRTFEGVLRVVPLGYLFVGGAWLAMSRFGARPLGLSDAIVELTAGGQHDHRHIALRPQPAQDLQTIALRQHPVQDDEIGPELLGRLERRLAVLRDVDLVAFVPQPQLEELDDRLLIVDHENPHCRRLVIWLRHVFRFILRSNYTELG